MNFYESWHFIAGHPRFMDNFHGEMLYTFPYGLDIYVVKVDPKTMSIDDDDEKNTKVQVWLEHGPYEKVKEFNNENKPTHDVRLDCGADNFEEAIIKLAKLIKKYYGTYALQKKET